MSELQCFKLYNCVAQTRKYRPTDPDDPIFSLIIRMISLSQFAQEFPGFSTGPRSSLPLNLAPQFEQTRTIGHPIHFHYCDSSDYAQLKRKDPFREGLSASTDHVQHNTGENIAFEALPLKK